MAVPLINFTQSDILYELGEDISLNSSIEGIFNNEFILPSGIDNTYCPGATPELRLANLKSKPYYIGKWRNYGIVNTGLPLSFLGEQQTDPFIWSFLLPANNYLVIHFNNYSVADRLVLTVEGVTEFDTGYVSYGSYRSDSVYWINSMPLYYYSGSSSKRVFLRVFADQTDTQFRINCSIQPHVLVVNSQLLNIKDESIVIQYHTQSNNYYDLWVSGGNEFANLEFWVTKDTSKSLTFNNEEYSDIFDMTDLFNNQTIQKGIHTSNLNRQYRIFTGGYSGRLVTKFMPIIRNSHPEPAGRTLTYSTGLASVS